MKPTNLFKFLSEPSSDPKISYDEFNSLCSNLRLSVEDELITKKIGQAISENRAPFVWGHQEKHFLDKCHDDDIVPYLIYRYKMSHYPTEKIVSDFPVYLLIEPASPCNLRCTMCFQVDKTFTKKKYMGYMDLNLYKKIIDDAAAGGTRAITFASRGEPLLHKELPEMLQYAADKKCFFDIKINTNGTKLTTEIAHAILKAGVSIVVISVDSSKPEEYESIRVGAKFDQVLENIKNFVDIRKNFYPDCRTEIRVAGVKVSEKQDEVEFNNFWSQIVDTVAITATEERWDTYNNEEKTIDTPCSYLWERMYIWWDGLANPCDVDYKSQLAVGHTTVDSIRSIWHSAQYKALRSAHLEQLRNNYIPCDRCGVS